MNKEVFLSELEQLLSGLPEQERLEALQYYQDYIEEAGPENEENVIRELGSPRKCAAAVMGQFREDEGEFTEKGFSNSSWEDPVEEIIPVKTREEKRRRLLKIGILAVFVIFVLPVIFRIAGSVFGFSLNILLTLIVVLIGVAVCTVVGMLIGVLGILVGFFLLFWMPMKGLALLGVGFVCLGLGMLGNVLCMRFYGHWLPSLLHAASEQVARLSKKGREGAE